MNTYTIKYLNITHSSRHLENGKRGLETLDKRLLEEYMVSVLFTKRSSIWEHCFYIGKDVFLLRIWEKLRERPVKHLKKPAMSLDWLRMTISIDKPWSKHAKWTQPSKSEIFLQFWECTTVWTILKVFGMIFVKAWLRIMFFMESHKLRLSISR